MLREEFERLTGIYPDMWLYDEINKIYNASELDKDVWCKKYKTNTDGMADGIARRVSERQWKASAEINKLGMRIALLEGNVAERNGIIEKLNEELKVARQELGKRIDQTKKDTADHASEIAKMEQKLEEKDLEILTLKAKLYDLMTK
ncbi:MAG: hypothetical protein IJ601_04425 [Acidaminococcaceae bacterium]|nr:hypothetical protein [Acidaminococcaceae bacterium]